MPRWIKDMYWCLVFQRTKAENLYIYDDRVRSSSDLYYSQLTERFIDRARAFNPHWRLISEKQ